MKTFLPKNMNTTDRVIRFILGILLLGYAYFKSSWVALTIGIFTFFEASFSWCIVYQILDSVVKLNSPKEQDI